MKKFKIPLIVIAMTAALLLLFFYQAFTSDGLVAVEKKLEGRNSLLLTAVFPHNWEDVCVITLEDDSQAQMPISRFAEIKGLDIKLSNKKLNRTDYSTAFLFITGNQLLDVVFSRKSHIRINRNNLHFYPTANYSRGKDGPYCYSRNGAKLKVEEDKITIMETEHAK